MRKGKRMKDKKNRMIAAVVMLAACLLAACGHDGELISTLEAGEDNLSVSVEQEADSREDMQSPDVENGAGSQAVSMTPEADEDGSDKIPRTIFVHVCGAVERPGVYEIPAGSRMFEAVEAAGGFQEEACQDYLNMAELLEDGTKLEIPTLEEAEALKEAGEAPEKLVSGTPGSTSSEKRNGDGATDLININTADIAELCTLPGIGESRARAILEYREKNGGFQKKEDIMQVSGIGQKMYEKIEEDITV